MPKTVYKNIKSLIMIILISTSLLFADASQKPKIIDYKRELKTYQTTGKEIGDSQGTKDVSTSAVTLWEILQYTALHNPKLKSYAWNVEGKDALILQSKKLTNPELESELENLGIDAFSISIGQLIELGGKRSSRIAMAKLEKSVAVWEYEIKRLQLLVEAGQQFIHTIQSQMMIDLLSESIEYAETSYQRAIQRKKAGVASQIDVLQTQKDLELTLLERDKELNQYKLNLNLLASFTGDMQTTFSHVIGDLKKPLGIPAFEGMISRISQSPNIIAWMIRSEMLQIVEKESKTQRIPDVSVNAGYERQNTMGDNTFLLGFSLPLPLFDRNKGNISAARINTYRFLFEKQVLELQIYNELLEKYTEFENTFKEIQIYSNSIIPLAASTYNEAQKFYKSGKISSLELLSYQRELLENEKYYINLTADFYLLKYDLELLIGSEIMIETGE